MGNLFVTGSNKNLIACARNINAMQHNVNEDISSQNLITFVIQLTLGLNVTNPFGAPTCLFFVFAAVK